MGQFLVASEDLPVSLANMLTGSFNALQLGYWHWVDNIWLIQTDKFSSAKELHSQIITSFPVMQPKTVVVLRLDSPRSYWGMAGKDGWEWLHQNGWGTAG